MAWYKKFSTLGVAFGLLVSGGVLTACGDSGGDGSTGVSDETIKLGAWMPLSGPIAPHGLIQRAGADAYFAKVNAEGGVNGRKIDWKVQDNAYDPAESVTVARRLISQDDVFAIFGANGTAQSEATFPVLEKDDVPIAFGIGGETTWYEPAKPILFGQNIPYEYQADSAAQWMTADGHKDVVALNFAGIGGQNAAKAFKTAFAGDGGTVSNIESPLPTNDWNPIVRDVIAKKPDAVVLFEDIGSAVGFLKEAKSQGLNVPVYGWTPLASAELTELAGDAAEGFKSLSLTVAPDTDTPEVKAFKEQLAKISPDVHPDGESMSMYAMAQVFVEALKGIDGEPTREKLLESLESMKDVETGLLPPLSFDAEHHLGSSCSYEVTVSGGEWTGVGEDPICARTAGVAALDALE